MSNHTVYILCFSEHYKRVKHYVGKTSLSIQARLARHNHGGGARLTRAARLAGIVFQIAALHECLTMEEASSIERTIKNKKNHRQFCPFCNEERR